LAKSTRPPSRRKPALVPEPDDPAASEDDDEGTDGPEGLTDLDLLRLDMATTILGNVIRSPKFTKAQFDHPVEREALVESCAQIADRLLVRTMQHDLPDPDET